MRKIRLVTTNKTEARLLSGMDLYRLAIPYAEIQKASDMKLMSLDEFDIEECDADIYVMNRPMSYRAQKVKSSGKFLIVDIDDFWVLPTWHPASPQMLNAQLDFAAKNPERVKDDEVRAVRATYNIQKDFPVNVLAAARMADLVTCSTEALQHELNKVGIEAVVVRNSIHPNLPQFSQYKNKSNRVRFGWVGGTFHRRDIALMYDGIRKLHSDPTEQGKYQIACSFNKHSDFIEYERIMTNNYQCCPLEYRDYLKSYSRLGSHIGNDQTYKRLWNLPVYEYGAHYEQIDVALIPLQHGLFNSCKSELKIIEAGMTGCAAIVSDVMPYNKWLKHGYNCLLTDGTNGWYTAMKMLINNPDLRQELANNLRKTIEENFDTIEQSNILATELNKLK